MVRHRFYSVRCDDTSSRRSEVLDFSLTIAGGLAWAWVGFMWHDRALLILNAVVTSIMVVGLLRLLP